MNPIKIIRIYQSLIFKGYLKEKGLIKSLIGKMPVNQNSEPIPWLTYPFIDFFVPRLDQTLNLFEFGAGNSTLFFSKYVKNITSVEDNKEWAMLLKNKLPENCVLIVADRTKEHYLSGLSSQKNKQDIIIIDGLFRNEYAGESMKYLTDGGVIVFDDSNRDIYSEAFCALQEGGFKRLDFWGLMPGSVRNNCTTLFYRENNCLGI
jgi:hypothetical protein